MKKVSVGFIVLLLMLGCAKNIPDAERNERIAKSIEVGFEGLAKMAIVNFKEVRPYVKLAVDQGNKYVMYDSVGIGEVVGSVMDILTFVNSRLMFVPDNSTVQGIRVAVSIAAGLVETYFNIEKEIPSHIKLYVGALTTGLQKALDDLPENMSMPKNLMIGE